MSNEKKQNDTEKNPNQEQRPTTKEDNLDPKTGREQIGGEPERQNPSPFKK